MFVQRLRMRESCPVDIEEEVTQTEGTAWVRALKQIEERGKRPG